jgi:hypothetical protein
MVGRMDNGYFAEKQERSGEWIKFALSRAEEASASIQAMRYGLPDVVAPKHVHEQLLGAKVELDSARREFEKARWANALVDMEFNDWLVKEGHADLVIG